MATAATEVYTPEDLLKIHDRPMPELVDGQLVERQMGQKSDAIGLKIAARILVHAETNDLGLANGSQGGYQIFPGEPNRVRIPDASFTRKDRLLPDGPFDGHSRVAPDLVVEVVSPNDNAVDLMVKINDYQSAGVPLIWVLVPQTRTVYTYTLEGSGPVHRPGDVLRGGDVLPGFECPVNNLFV